MDIPAILKSTLVKIGRTIEFLITGQSEFKITTSEFEVNDKPNVRDLTVAKKLLEEMKSLLAGQYGIKVTYPVVIELIKEQRIWEYSFSWCAGSLGKYRSHLMFDEKYHMVYILSGLKRERFKAILAHELTHAFLYEKKLFTENKSFREAMARWVEYRILLSEGEKHEAGKLLKIKSWMYGRGIVKILALEKKVGREHLVAHLLSLREQTLREV
ncbi:MAG: hypothetical protein RDV48_16905 [Candidatus Eremiobacteraeota bacterium]|nr:hypothetical protein [Candidatus Eremiobacteraeota bacterium]